MQGQAVFAVVPAHEVQSVAIPGTEGAFPDTQGQRTAVAGTLSSLPRVEAVQLSSSELVVHEFYDTCQIGLDTATRDGVGQHPGVHAVGSEDRCQFLLGLYQTQLLAKAGGLQTPVLGDRVAQILQPCVQPVFTYLDWRKACIAALLPLLHLHGDILDRYLGDRVELAQEDHQVQLSLPAGLGGGWEPVLMTSVGKSGLSAGGLATAAGSAGVRSAFHGFLDPFAVGGMGLEVDKGAFRGHDGVGLSHRSGIDTDGHILDVTVFPFGELYVEELVLETFDRFALRDELSCSGWVAWHQGLAGLGDDRHPSCFL